VRKTMLLCLITLILYPVLSGRLYGDFIYRVDFTSRYIWRGFDLNPDKQPALQPSFEYSCGDCGMTFNLWSSFSFSNKDYNEIDLSFTYDFKISDNFSLSAGIIHYGWYFVHNFSFDKNTSQEIFISALLPNLSFHPKLTVFYDFGIGNGFYILLETFFAHDFSSSLGSIFSASFGYNGGQWLAEGTETGFSDLNLGAVLLFKFKRFIISPFSRYTFVLLDGVSNGNHFWFGISMTFKS
jgi:uncharacterized protein (TIGR02001 family)